MIRWRRMRVTGGSVTVAVQDWQPLDTTAAWSASAGAAPAAYYKDPFGVVHLRGGGTSAGGTVAVLPSSCRPEYPESFGDVQIAPSGAISTLSGAISLSGILFRPGE